MTTRKRIKFFLTIFCAFVGVALLAGWLCHTVRNRLREARLISAMGFMHVALREGLNRYYRDHGQYPARLSDLSGLKFADGASPEMLANFLYVSNGSIFHLSWRTPAGRDIRLRGENGVIVTDDWVVPPQVK